MPLHYRTASLIFVINVDPLLRSMADKHSNIKGKGTEAITNDNSTMDNGGFNPEATTIVNLQESHSKGHTVVKFNEVDLNRAASLTSDEDQITFSWENITIKTKATSRGLPFGKSESKPSRVLVDNSE